MLNLQDPRLTDFAIERIATPYVRAKFRWNGRRGITVGAVIDELLSDEALEKRMRFIVLALTTDPNEQAESEGTSRITWTESEC